MAENTGITYIRGDATAPEGKGERAHNDFGLGAVQFVQVGDDLWVANVVGQRGILPSSSRPGSRSAKRGAPFSSEGAPVRDEAIDVGLGRIAARARQLGASVHMPRIGCGLAGGVWSRVEPLISGRLTRCGIPVTVYDR